MMPTIGIDCDLLLIHPHIDGGYPYGFVLAPDPANKGSAISIQRELDEDNEVHIYIFFTVILADQLKNPDGSMHTANRGTMYMKLLAFLAKTEDLAIGTVMGTYLGVGPLGHSATELHLIDGSYISCKLTNLGKYHPPIDSGLFFGSLWQDNPPSPDALTWDTSVWR